MSLTDGTRADLSRLAEFAHPELARALRTLIDADSRASEVARLEADLQRARDLNHELRRHLDAREVQWRMHAESAEREYVRALNAILASRGGDGPDVDRWRGNAETWRRCAQAARRQAGDAVPDYRSVEWRARNGVYSAECVEEWRGQEARVS